MTTSFEAELVGAVVEALWQTAMAAEGWQRLLVAMEMSRAHVVALSFHTKGSRSGGFRSSAAYSLDKF